MKNFLWRRRQEPAASLILNSVANEDDLVTMACLAAHADSNESPFWPAQAATSAASASLVIPQAAETTAGTATAEGGSGGGGGDLSELLSQMQAYLPSGLVERWATVLAVWESRVKPRYMSELVHMSREEAELEYLRLAQKQPCFGVSLHPIYVSACCQVLKESCAKHSGFDKK